MNTAIVTGAARRVGRAIALTLARSGWDVVLHYRSSRPDAEVLAKEIEALGRRSALVHADLNVFEQVSTLVETSVAALGPVNALVNCASVFEDDHISSMTKETWERHIDANLRAPILLTQTFAKLLPMNVEGAVVNIIDQMVLNHTPQFFSYAVSKSALWAATPMMAQALAPRIRVNAVSPGPTLKAASQSQANFDAQVCGTLLKRPSLPEDIAEAVLYLLKAKSVTGQMITVDSGQHLSWRQDDLIS